MGQTFVNAPLVEIVAELYWDPTQNGKIDLSKPAFALNDADTEKYYSNFCDLAVQKNFGQSERVIPVGAPCIVGMPAMKVRQPKNKSILFQLGPGLFTANAVQPYKSWDEFAPVVQDGVECLLEARAESQKAKKFSKLRLRYIDAFKDNLIQDMPREKFINEILNVKFSLPESLSPNPGTLKSNLKFSFEDKSGFKINLSIAEGKVNQESALIMDTLVETKNLAPNIELVMESFGKARRIIHDMFFSLTKPLHPVMKLEGGE